jgi:hypothetical protein
MAEKAYKDSHSDISVEKTALDGDVVHHQLAPEMEMAQYEGSGAKEGHLQRGLKARQVSMIAVRFFTSSFFSAFI